MAVIHIISLDAVTVQAVKNKRYSEEKIVELNDRLQADTKKKKKVFLIVMTAFSIFLFVYGIFTFKRSIGFPEAIPIVLSFFPIIAIVGLAVWFLSIGYISWQWNDLIRKYYPSVYTVINGRPDAAGFSDTDKTSGTSKTSDKSGVSGQTENAEFAALEKDIEELNSIYIKQIMPAVPGITVFIIQFTRNCLRWKAMGRSFWSPEKRDLAICVNC